MNEHTYRGTQISIHAPCGTLNMFSLARIEHAYLKTAETSSVSSDPNYNLLYNRFVRLLSCCNPTPSACAVTFGTLHDLVYVMASLVRNILISSPRSLIVEI